MQPAVLLPLIASGLKGSNQAGWIGTSYVLHIITTPTHLPRISLATCSPPGPLLPSLVITQVIEVDASSHRGYEGKYAALHGMGRHGEALEAFRMMLLKLAQSSHSQIRGLPEVSHYITITDTREL